LKNRDYLTHTIQNLDNVDIITKEKQVNCTTVGASIGTVIGTTTKMTTSTTADDVVNKGKMRFCGDNDCIIEAVESSTSQCRGETEGI